MASLFNKVVQLANSPKGKQAIQQATVKAQQLANSPKGQQVIRQAADKAQQLAKDPKTRARIDDARRRLQGGQGGTGSGSTAP